MDHKVKYLIKNIGLLAFSNFSSKVLVFLLVPLYTNVLTTLEYGIYDLAISTVSLLAPVLTINISDAVMRFLINEKKEKEAQKAELEKPKKGETKPASAKPNSQNSEIHLKHPTDRIEISKEGKEYTNTSEAPENTSGAESIPVSQPDTVENPLPEILANAQKAKTAPKTS